jgi:hypothetical protein
MNLTLAQLQTIKSAIASTPAMASQPNNPDGNTAIAALANALASPDFWVWKSRVTKDELVNSTSVDNTTFNWTGTGYMTRSQGERDTFLALFDRDGAVNPSLATVRAAFSAIFTGATAPAPANLTHLATVARRKATVLEKLFAVGTGSTASPATMAVEGVIAHQDIESARNS